MVGMRFPNVLFSDYRITWSPILGKYSFSWLRISTQRRRDWGPDWWENDEWFSLECSYRESLDLYNEHSQELSFILDDDELRYYSMPHPIAYPSPVLLPKYCSHQVSALMQQRVFNRLNLWETRYIAFYEPVLLNYLHVSNELKYTNLTPIHEVVYQGTNRYVRSEHAYFCNVLICFMLERDEVEIPLENQYGRSRVAKFLRVYAWHVWDLLVRLKHDYRNVAIISFFFDLLFRGFSLVGLRKRFRETYHVIRNLGFFETYVTALLIIFAYMYKRKIFFFLPKICFIMLFFYGMLLMATLARDVREMTETADDVDPDLIRDKFLYTPLDPEIDEILNPMELEVSVGAVEEDAGVVGQEDEDWDFCDPYLDEWTPLLYDSEHIGQAPRSNIGTTQLSGLDYVFMERYLPKMPNPPTFLQYLGSKLKWLFDKINGFLYKHLAVYRVLVDFKRRVMGKIRAVRDSIKARIKALILRVKNYIKQKFEEKKKRFLDFMDQYPLWWYFYRRFKIWRLVKQIYRPNFAWWQRWRRHNWWDWGNSLTRFDWVTQRIPGYYKYLDGGHGFSDILGEVHDFLNQRRLDKIAAWIVENEKYVEDLRRMHEADEDLRIRRIIFPAFYPPPFYIEHD